MGKILATDEIGIGYGSVESKKKPSILIRRKDKFIGYRFYHLGFFSNEEKAQEFFEALKELLSAKGVAIIENEGNYRAEWKQTKPKQEKH